jgi:hypothetical protein
LQAAQATSEGVIEGLKVDMTRVKDAHDVEVKGLKESHAQ